MMSTNDEQLTEMCRVIFGDVVKTATYQTEDNVKYKTPCDIQFNCIGDLDYSGREFVVEFINGVKVKFWNSEWATLERLNHDNPTVL